MSLIVARALPGQLRLVGDTRITDRAAIQRGAFAGALRHVIIGPELCFASAGEVERGQQTLQKVAALYKAGEPLEEMVDAARAAHAAGGVEFLLGWVAEGEAQLTRVAGGHVERDQPFAWIGDPDAFAVYQAARAKTPRDPDGVPNLLKAFHGLLNGSGAVRVDAPCLAIATLAQGLTYAPIGVLDRGSRRSADGLWAGDGGYGYTVLAPARAGLSGIGVWFEGRLGALFHPERRADPIVYRNVSLDDFRRVIALDFGVESEELRLEAVAG